MSTPAEKFQYQVGGSLEKQAPCYVTRQADEDFYQALRAGEFCYVLNSRQMGKSSLRVRVMQRLQAEGVACAVIDITSIGSQGITAAEWYLGIIRRLVRAFRVKLDALEWWNGREGLSPVQRLSEFLEEELLVAVTQPIAIFIDEIDSILKLDFKDDFFALIRACYNQRAERSDYQRLTFALLGVATPNNLIQDKNRTPFNIGRAIQLNGFQFEEARSLAQGLAGKAVNPEAVLHAILHWTGGQPFLTQKLCQFVLACDDSIPEGEEEIWIRTYVQMLIIEDWEFQDEPEHLRTIRDRLLHTEDPPSKSLLEMYQHILNQGKIISEDNNISQLALRLTGLVVKRDNMLQVYNPIYAKVFDQGWLNNLRVKTSESIATIKRVEYDRSLPDESSRAGSVRRLNNNRGSSLIYLLVIVDEMGRRELLLDAPTYSIGRAAICDIRLVSQFVSRRHATLVQVPNDEGTDYTYRIIDGAPRGKSSANGLFINGHKLNAHDLENEDIITFCRGVDEVYAIYHLIETDTDQSTTTAYNPYIEDYTVGPAIEEEKITFCILEETPEGDDLQS